MLFSGKSKQKNSRCVFYDKFPRGCYNKSKTHSQEKELLKISSVVVFHQFSLTGKYYFEKIHNRKYSSCFKPSVQIPSV